MASPTQWTWVWVNSGPLLSRLPLSSSSHRRQILLPVRHWPTCLLSALLSTSPLSFASRKQHRPEHCSARNQQDESSGQQPACSGPRDKVVAATWFLFMANVTHTGDGLVTPGSGLQGHVRGRLLAPCSEALTHVFKFHPWHVSQNTEACSRFSLLAKIPLRHTLSSCSEEPLGAVKSCRFQERLNNT